MAVADANPLAPVSASADNTSASLVMVLKGQFLGIDRDDTAFIPAARALQLYNREGLRR